MRCDGCIFKDVYETMGARIDTCMLQDCLSDAVKACDNSANCSHRVTLEEAKKKCLSSDVVEVVRCRDCKHGQPHKRIGVVCEYDQNGPYRAFSAFCSCGERREG